MSDQAVEDRTPDGARILANVREIAPLLRDEAAGNEARRGLSPRTVDALRSTGVFRMPVPRGRGGPEIDVLDQAEIIEELSTVDGSAGWCVLIGAAAGFFSAGLTDAAARRLFPDPDAIVAGWVAPVGALHERDGGYLLEGHWRFASGCTHADVILSGAVVHRDGAPVLSANGTPEVRMALAPAGEFEILETWDTTGLAASGSHDYRTGGTFVPRDQTFRFSDIATGPHRGTLYRWPGLFSLATPAVPLGIARAALADAEDLLAGKILMPENRPAVEDARVRRAVAVAHARIGSARAYTRQELSALWSLLDAGGQPSVRQRAAVIGAVQHAVRTCRDTIRDLADVVGSASIHRRNPFENRLRDLTTIGQHVVGQDGMTELAGSLWLGVESLYGSHPLVVSGVL